MTNFRLKDCKEIKIRTVSPTDKLPTSLDDTDNVERIRILNDIVWEKSKNTVTQLTASSNNILYGDSFTLTASTSLEQSGNTSTIVDGIIKFYKNNTLIDTKSTSNGTAQLTVMGDEVGTNTYKAIFTKEKYNTSSASVSVTVSKKTPTLSNIGTNTVYKTWYMGIKLTDSGKPLSNKTIKITVNGVTYNKTTDNNGVAKLKNNALNEGIYDVSYVFDGDDTYDSVSTTRKYTMKDYQTTTLAVSNVNGASDSDKSAPNQRWEKISNTEYHCYKNGLKCHVTNDVIATASGTYKKPAPLIITFNTNNINTIYEANLSFTSNQSKGCTGASGGALFDIGPTIGLDVGTGYDNKIGKAFTKWNYYKNYYASKGPISESLKWSYNGKQINNSLKIKIDYPANSGVEEGYLTIKNLKLTISYTPVQEALK